jgi:hypothetical protein
MPPDSYDFNVSAAVAATIVKHLHPADRQEVFEMVDKLDDLLQELKNFRSDMTLHELIGGVAMTMAATCPSSDGEFSKICAGLQGYQAKYRHDPGGQ